jgi:hypothetical protein
MPLNIPTGYFQIAFYHSLSNSQRVAVCTIGAQYIGTDFANEVIEMANVWGSAVMPQLSSGVVYNRCTVSNDIGVVEDMSVNFAGGITEAAAPWQVAYLIKKVTSFPGRFNRGRMYLPGVDETKIDNAGRIDAAKVTTLAQAMVSLGVGMGQASFNPQLLHNSPPDRAPTSITALNVDPFVATQRRRLRG